MEAATRGPARWTTTLDLDVRVHDTRCGPIEAATAGEGPAVLLLHGIPGSWRQCVPTAEDLEGMRVVLPSRPGYGATPIDTGRTYEEQADAFAALLDAQGIEKCAVIGVSGGGPAAVALAARHHERVGALVMACAMAPHLISLTRGMRVLRLPGVAESVFPVHRYVARRRINRAWALPDSPRLRESLTTEEIVHLEADPRIRDDLLRHALSHAVAPAALAGQRNDLAQIERVHRGEADPYNLVTCPSLLLYGGSDAVVDAEHGRFYGGVMPGAELVLFEGAGHLFLITRRSEASAAIRAFIERSL